MKNKLINILLVTLLLLSFAVGCTKNQTTESTSANPKELKTVRLGFPGSKSFMGGIAGIAQDKGYFNEELEKVGYKIEYVPFAAAGPAVNEALASKKIDFAIYADFPGLVLKSKGIGISLLAIPDNYTNATLLVKKDSLIKSIKDLKGKKVAFTKGTFMQKVFLELLQSNGLNEKDVNIINVITTDAASALLSGNVDALVYVDSSIVPLLADKSAREIESTRNHSELRAQSVFVGNDEFIKGNPDAPVAIIKALIRARDFVKSNPNDSLKIWTKSGLSTEALKIFYGTDSEKYQSYFPIEISQDSINKLTNTKNFLLNQKLIAKDYDINEFAKRSFYDKAIK